MANYKATAKVPSGGVSGLTLLLLLFIALKLTGFIGWSWLWVLAPLWAPFAVILGGLAIYIIFMFILDGVDMIRRRFK